MPPAIGFETKFQEVRLKNCARAKMKSMFLYHSCTIKGVL
jgi:hypothetical protein